MTGMLALVAACSQQDAPLTAAATGKVASAANEPPAPQLVAEVTSLLYSNDTQAEGSVEMSGIAACGGVKYSGGWTALDGMAVPMRDSGVLSLAFEPGVQHRFNGKVCLPAAQLPYTEDAKADASFKSVLVGEKYVTVVDGPAKFSGTATFKPEDGAGKVFIVESDASAPLTLLVTREGYRHQSGKGSVTTPAGRRYEFR